MKRCLNRLRITGHGIPPHARPLGVKAVVESEENMTTYEQENKKYLKSIPYSNLKKGFLENINENLVFKDLIDFLDEKNKNYYNNL